MNIEKSISGDKKSFIMPNKAISLSFVTKTYNTCNTPFNLVVYIHNKKQGKNTKKKGKYIYEKTSIGSIGNDIIT